MLDKAKVKIVPLTQVINSLGTLALDVKPVPADTSETDKKKIEAENKVIQTHLDARANFKREATTLIGEATPKTAAAERDKMRKLENERPDIQGRLQTASTELEKKTLRSALHRQALKEKEAFDKYADLLARLESKQRDLAAHSDAMKKIGAK